MNKSAKYFETQCNQLHHLLTGGILTKAQVVKSGLGEGVLIEQRHYAWQYKNLHNEHELLRARFKTCIESLESIGSMKRCRPASSLARSTVTFLAECERERLKRNL